MHDFEVIDSQSRPRNLGDVIGTDTVLMCHVVNPLLELDYYRYLEQLGCRVIMVVGKDNPLIHIMAMTHGLRMETYTDPQHNLASHIKRQQSIDMEPTPLAKVLRSQTLFHGGVEVATWLQPISGFWKDFLSESRFLKNALKRFGTHAVKWLRDQNKENELIWKSQIPQWGYKATYDDEYDCFMKHYRLMPNPQLEQKLVDLRSHSK